MQNGKNLSLHFAQRCVKYISLKVNQNMRRKNVRNIL